MTNNLQKKLASQILKVGTSKVWLDPSKVKDIDAGITKADIRRFIQKGWIKSLPEKVAMPREKGKRRRGAGRRKGSKYAKLSRKRRWMNTVRPLRRMLVELRAARQIDNATYRNLYMLVKGGMFRSRSHLRIYLEQRGILKSGGVKTGKRAAKK
jgi:large subunit ribosomal protein L19e